MAEYRTYAMQIDLLPHCPNLLPLVLNPFCIKLVTSRGGHKAQSGELWMQWVYYNATSLVTHYILLKCIFNCLVSRLALSDLDLQTDYALMVFLLTAKTQHCIGFGKPSNHPFDTFLIFG